jgi:hypothetical protein
MDEIRFIKEDLESLTKHKNARIAYTAGVLLFQRTLEEAQVKKYEEENGDEKNE